MSPKKVAVILSGCGVHDGSEIHESVLVLLALDRAGAEVACAAPDVPQSRVVDHLTGKAVAGSPRGVLAESARIARGHLLPLNRLDADSFDAVILPGGHGAAATLCNFDPAGPGFEVLPELARVLLETRRLGKPMGFACIAPVIAARLFGREGLEYTLGNDAGTVQALSGTGARHINCPAREIVVDRRLRIVTTPAYMLARRIIEAEAGINRMVQAVLELV